jgi:hypothetical protein
MTDSEIVQKIREKLAKSYNDKSSLDLRTSISGLLHLKNPYQLQAESLFAKFVAELVTPEPEKKS